MSTVAIYRGPTRGYSLTDDDVLWLARGFVGEFEGHLTRKNAQWHFWCWMDRFLLINGGWLKDNRSFYDFIRSHSQAINPIWMTPGSAKCASSSTGACAPDKIARRARMCSLGISQLQSYGSAKAPVYQWALEAQAGTLERPTSAALYNFAACNAIKENQSDRPCPGIDVDGQCFIIHDCFMGKYDGSLKMNDDGSLPDAVSLGIATKTIGKTVVAVLFGVVVVWAIWTLKPWKRGKKGK
jgi:hypothetical protein